MPQHKSKKEGRFKICTDREVDAHDRENKHKFKHGSVGFEKKQAASSQRKNKETDALSDAPASKLKAASEQEKQSEKKNSLARIDKTPIRAKNSCICTPPNMS
jgi:hypothetical protein